jgi:hypothetical protein
MNHSTTSTPLSSTLQKEAENLLLKGFQEARLEAITDVVANSPKLYADFLQHGPTPLEDEPWFVDAVRTAIMPDRSMCQRTLEDAVRSQTLSSVTHFHIEGASKELRKTMIDSGHIYRFIDTAQEGEDPAEVAVEMAEVTGYGLARLLNINLHDFLANCWHPCPAPR